MGGCKVEAGGGGKSRISAPSGSAKIVSDAGRGLVGFIGTRTHLHARYYPSDLIPEIPRLRRFSRNMTGDFAVADSLVQECLAKALESIPIVHDGTNLRIWLFSVFMDRFALFNLRHKRALTQRKAEEAAETKAVDNDERLGDRSSSGMQAALMRLSVEHRALLLLVVTEGLPCDQAAGILDISVSIAKRRLSRARVLLSALVKSEASQENLVS
jgi:RNA polymerase sigma-70 factor, ECF subfamily